MVIPRTEAEVGHCLQDKAWRKNNLYTIVNESGEKEPYRQRQVQSEFYRRRHMLDVILKSRQHGFSTEVDIDMLDDCIFTPDLQCGIIAHTLNDAQEIFQTKVKLPYFELPEFIRDKNPPLKSDGCTLRLANGSSIRVAVSFRSATTHRLHVSELGKICAKYPKRAIEIKTGTLPSVHPQMGGRVVIEGTAEGDAGDFYDLCIQARADTIQAEREGRPLHPLQYKFHFYSWFRDPKNAVDPLGVVISDELKTYFAELAASEVPIITTPEQQAWYSLKRDGPYGLGRLMKREHPSTVEEAFEHSVTGAVFAFELDKVHAEGRIKFLPYEESEPVYTFWDLGLGHPTAIGFVQFIQEEVRIIDYHEVTGRGIVYHCGEVKKKPYIYGHHYLPHDARNRSRETETPLIDTAKELLGPSKVTLVERCQSKADSIQAARMIFPHVFFEAKKTTDLRKGLGFYRYEWDEDRARFKDIPEDDWAADPADMFQCLGVAWVTLSIGGKLGDAEYWR
jgi:hypothetical protein